MIRITLAICCFCCLGYYNLVAQHADIRILRQINTTRNKALDPMYQGFSNSVNPLAIGIPLVALTRAWLVRDSASRQQAILLAGSAAVSAVITTSLKYGINRTRPWVTYPEIEHLGDAGGPSFPSGHTAASFALATSLSIAYPKWYVIVPAFAWSTTVGYSRMHLGCHYPSDVIAGALCGSGSAWITWKASQWLNKRKINPLLF